MKANTGNIHIQDLKSMPENAPQSELINEHAAEREDDESTSAEASDVTDLLTNPDQDTNDKDKDAERDEWKIQVPSLHTNKLMKSITEKTR